MTKKHLSRDCDQDEEFSLYRTRVIMDPTNPTGPFITQEILDNRINMTKKHLSKEYEDKLNKEKPEQELSDVDSCAHCVWSTYVQPDVGDIIDDGIDLMIPVSEELAKMNIPDEMFDFLQILIPGAKKHGNNTWLQPEYKRDWADKAFHHAARAFANPGSLDEESGLDHDLHAAINHLMLYTRRKRGLE